LKLNFVNRARKEDFQTRDGFPRKENLDDEFVLCNLLWLPGDITLFGKSVWEGRVL
jgi:hypothetical protein